MCTVTIVPFGGGVRLVCNRDERRSRPEALPPATRSTRSGSAAYPVDPMSGGTWVGVADCGVAAVLLNRTRFADGGRPSGVTRSRGAIVPLVLGCSSFERAVDAAAEIDCRGFEPFTLVVVNRSRAVAFTSDRVACARETCILTAPRLFTSSSLGDAVVDLPRRLLFDDMVGRAADPLAAQRRFHRHQWPCARHVSVCMERGDAATVSRTTIDLVASGARIAYEPLPCISHARVAR
jgi:Transport and Golgi organisation 2